MPDYPNCTMSDYPNCIPISRRETFIRCCRLLNFYFPYNFSSPFPKMEDYYRELWDAFVGDRLWSLGENPFVILAFNKGERSFRLMHGDTDFLYKNAPSYISEHKYREFAVPINDSDLPSIENWINEKVNEFSKINESFYINNYDVFVETIQVLINYKFGVVDSKDNLHPATIRSCLYSTIDQLNLPRVASEYLESFEDIFKSNYLRIRLDLELHPATNNVASLVVLKMGEGIHYMPLQEGEAERVITNKLVKCVVDDFPPKKEVEKELNSEPVDAISCTTERETMSDKIKKAASTVINTVKEGASMGPPALIVTRIVDRVEGFLLKKGILREGILKTKLWKTCRNPVCVGVAYFALLLLPLPAGSKAARVGLTAVNLALKKVSADATQGVGGELLCMIEGVVTDVEHLLPSNEDPTE